MTDPPGYLELIRGSRHVVESNDPERRAVAKRFVRHYASEFKATGNPVFAWAAIKESLAVGLRIPKWVNDYLYETASRLHALSVSEPPPPDGIAPAVAKATGLVGRGGFNPFRALSAPAHELVIAGEVYAYKLQHEHYGWQAVFKDVAEAHRDRCQDCATISPGKVKALWYRHWKTVAPSRLVERSNSPDDIFRQQPLDTPHS